MNYLGHIYLSGEDELLMIGNFIGDYVKGKQYQNYPVKVKEGILLHRAIDHFTDNNLHWIKIRDLLKPVYRRYAGVVADIFIDHFLAKNWNRYSTVQLDWHSKWAYAAFLRHYTILPKRVQGFVPFLIQHRRLQSYATFEGLDTSLQIMSLRTSLPDCTEKAMELLHLNYNAFTKHAIDFLDDVSTFVGKQPI